MPPMPPTVQCIPATSDERAIVVGRAATAERAAMAATDAQQVSNEVFTLFCRAHGLPDGCQFIGVDGEHILVRIPAIGGETT